MARKAMTTEDLKVVMSLAKQCVRINYMTPSIHMHSGYVTSIKFDLYGSTELFSVVNNPNPNYSLYKEVTDFLLSLMSKSDRDHNSDELAKQNALIS